MTLKNDSQYDKRESEGEQMHEEAPPTPGGCNDPGVFEADSRSSESGIHTFRWVTV